MARVLVAVALSLGLVTAGCQEDSPQQDPPSGIFTTTSSAPQAPTTTPVPASPYRY